VSWLVRDTIESSEVTTAFGQQTPPAVPGFHYYWFVVDGLNVNDPASYTYFVWAGRPRHCSAEAGVDFYNAKEGVPTAKCARVGISRRSRQMGRVNVYTPPDYDKDSNARYPVLCLLHGAARSSEGG